MTSSDPAGAADAVPALAATRPEDVVNAYRAFFGRSPESETVIADNLQRTPAEIAAVLARSAEFAAKLRDFATGRVTPHVTLSEEALEEAAGWARGLGLLPPEGDGAHAAASPALLLAGLLASPLVQAEAERLPEEVRALLAAGLRPEETALHRLSRPATEEDGRMLARLLFGPDPYRTPAGPPAGTLYQLLRETLGQPQIRTDLLHPLARGDLPPVFGLSAAEAEECARWLETRLGLPVRTEEGGALSLGALLAGFLRLPATDELLARIWPADHPAALAALPALESGAHLLLARRATAEDVGLAYLTILGRAAESEAVRQAHEGAPFARLIGALLASPEFRAQVLGRLAAGRAVPHLALALEQRRMVDAWLAGRLGLPAREGTPSALHPMALLARLAALPAIRQELERLHGELWADAAGTLRAWLEESARGLTGGIDYVTGDWIAGWAMDRRAPGTPLDIEIHCNGVLVAFGRADRPRPAAAEVESEAERRCGFRLPWPGRSRLRGPAPEGYRFQIVDPRSGRRIGPAFELDSVFVNARSTLQLVTAELAQMRETVRRLEALLPQLESFAAFPPEDHAGFRRQHRVPPPPSPLPPPASGTIRVVVPGEGVSVRGLRRTLDSLAAQLWPHWTALLLVTTPDQQALAEAAAARDPRIRWRAAAGPEAELAAERAAAEEEGPETLALLLPPGALLDASALAWFAHAASAFPGAAGFFCDEDAVVEEARDRDRHEAPVFRTALDHWELPRRNPCGEILCARRGPALVAALAHAAEVPGRAARRWVAWAALARQAPVGHIPRLLVSIQRDALDPPPAEAEPAVPPAAALRPLLRRPWLLDPDPPAAPAAAARISVIVPTRNGAAVLRDSLRSLLDRAAEPQALDLTVVDNGSDQPETLAYLEEERARGRIAVLRVDEPFNWSRLNNLAVRATRGELLLFLNDDTRMLTAGWDRILRRLLAEPDVGAVGARLVYEDLTIQHAGVVLGVEGLAAHEGVGAAMEAGGPGGRWQSLRAVGAVTGAFLACRREAFERVGPFDEVGLGVTFNDVDFCLRLRAAGLAVLYAPEIALVHFESKSRGIDYLDARKQERAEFERRKLLDRWGEALLLDPGFNPHWSRWTAPFAAIREPSPAEIARHLAASAAPDPWSLAPPPRA